ncbi:MAG: DNA-formamidopyrimidine glycosylase family protein [Deinococcales bacterium]
MPELPDIEAYRAALAGRAVGRRLLGTRLRSVFLLRTVEPPLGAFEGRTLTGTRRIGKRLVLAFEEDASPLFLVLHLMLAGRLSWGKPGAGLPGRRGLAALDFDGGTLLVTEAGSRRMASLHAAEGEAALAELDPGGLEPLEAPLEVFVAALRRERHTLKRALTSPHLIAGIGGAYADEILHAARLSPVALTTSLDDAALARLHQATQEVLRFWVERLGRAAREGGWPTVTAFQEGMAVHGRYRQPCPRCGDPVQRIRYADRETDYCATCQTGGTVLADRSLSRLLGKDWPRSLEAWEERVGRGSG